MSQSDITINNIYICVLTVLLTEALYLFSDIDTSDKNENKNIERFAYSLAITSINVGLSISVYKSVALRAAYTLVR